MEEQHPKLQAVMDRAYKGFGPKMSLKEFYQSLDVMTMGLVGFGNLNYQVENGGFSQWIYNGYSCAANAITWRLKVLATPEALKAAELLNEALRRYNAASTDDPEEDEDEGDYADYSDLDDAFYEINDQVLAQLEAGL